MIPPKRIPASEHSPPVRFFPIFLSRQGNAFRDLWIPVSTDKGFTSLIGVTYPIHSHSLRTLSRKELSSPDSKTLIAAGLSLRIGAGASALVSSFYNAGFNAIFRVFGPAHKQKLGCVIRRKSEAVYSKKNTRLPYIRSVLADLFEVFSTGAQIFFAAYFNDEVLGGNRLGRDPESFEYWNKS